MAVKAVLLGSNGDRTGTWSTFRKMRLEDEKTRDFEATEQGHLTTEERLIRDLTQIEGLGPEAEKFLWTYAASRDKVNRIAKIR